MHHLSMPDMKQIHPSVRYLIVCEDILTDPSAKTVSLINLLSAQFDLWHFPALVTYVFTSSSHDARVMRRSKSESEVAIRGDTPKLVR
jgi:hypothetical protein